MSKTCYVQDSRRQTQEGEILCELRLDRRNYLTGQECG